MTPDLTGRTVMVTGAGGFIASHLVEDLVRAGARVRALVHYNSRNHWGHLEALAGDIREAIEVRPGDVRDPFLVDRCTEGVDTVFHLAALIPIPYSYVAPGEYLDTNIRGTLNVLEACRRQGVARMIHTSTSETYGTARYTPIDEEHPLQGQSPYSASKIGADKLAESYWRSFETPVVTIRPFNTYGPRQSARAFLPSVLTQILTSDVVQVGSLDPVRDMNYVADTTRGFLLAATSDGAVGETINLGTGRGVTMQVLLDLAVKATGRTVRVETDPARVRPARSEVFELICDATRARDILGWAPEVSLEEGVERTSAWIAEHLDDYKPGLYNV
jgi:NAD dependent epimerase/dehydratase